jgi:hypothetical protein
VLANRAKAITRPPYRNALVVTTIAMAMSSVFAVSYTWPWGARYPTTYPRWSEIRRAIAPW